MTATSGRLGFVKPGKRADYEFLAPALEVLETPPSPVRYFLIWIICAFVLVSVTWAYFGRLDIIAVAQGKVQPVGKIKVVQPLITGKVIALPPVNGSKVKQGQIVVTLDPTESSADVQSIQQTLASTEAEISRREAAISAVKNGTYSSGEVEWSQTASGNLKSREERLLEAELMQLKTSIASLEAQRSQKEVQRDRLQDTIASQTSLVSTLQDRVNMRSVLVDRSAGSISNVIDATESLKEQMTQLVSQKGQLADAAASLPVLDREIAKTRQMFLADQFDKLNTAEKSAEELRQRFTKASSIQSQMNLRSPIDGIVQASSITSIGQVINSGQEVLRIVPEGGELELEVYVANKDIGFVYAGQEAVIKLEAFPFTRYGTLKGTVTKVSADAVPEPDASRLEGDPTATRPSMFAGAERVQNLVFPVTVQLGSTSVQSEQGLVAVSMGMAATAEIKTGTRRILDYLFSPLVEVANAALRER